jgi:hypothetical protein
LVERATYDDLNDNIKIIVYNANTPPSDHRGPHLVAEKFQELIKTNNIEIIENPGFELMVT